MKYISFKYGRFLFCTLSAFAALTAHAQTDGYCLTPDRVNEIRDGLSDQKPDMQRAYNKLFKILSKKSNAGCATQKDLDKICKNIWDDDTEMCESFLYSIVTSAQNGNFETLEYSSLLQKTDFSDINPDAFSQAVNKTLDRRANKSTPSKLQDMGPAFLQHASEKQINPFIAAAISMYESGYGTHMPAKNNIAGLHNGTKWLVFETVPDSIAKQAATLFKHIHTKDLFTLAHSGKYCSVVVAEKWSNDIASITKRLYQNYNEIIQAQDQNQTAKATEI